MKINLSFVLCLVFVYFNVTIGRFYAGRIKPNRFEYPKHNGWMLPREAKVKCEADISCGGFTFKGSYRTENLPVEVYFFHFVPPEDAKQRQESAKLYFHPQDGFNIDLLQQERNKRKKTNSNKYLYWSTYEVERDHVVLFNMKIENVVHSRVVNLSR